MHIYIYVVITSNYYLSNSIKKFIFCISVQEKLIRPKDNKTYINKEIVENLHDS